jgi:hypothetical protein
MLSNIFRATCPAPSATDSHGPSQLNIASDISLLERRDAPSRKPVVVMQALGKRVKCRWIGTHHFLVGEAGGLKAYLAGAG